MLRRQALLLLAVLSTAQLATAELADAAPRKASKAAKSKKAKKARKAKAAAPTPTPAPVAETTTAHAYLRAVEQGDRMAQSKILAAGRRGYLAGDGTKIVAFPDKSGIRVRRDGSKAFLAADVTADVKGLEPAALVSSL